jgi:hypothetical protein
MVEEQKDYRRMSTMDSIHLSLQFTQVHLHYVTESKENVELLVGGRTSVYFRASQNVTLPRQIIHEDKQSVLM